MLIDLILSDVHIPYHDKFIIETVIKYIKKLKPNTIYLAGDIIDFLSRGTYLKPPDQIGKLQQDLNMLYEFLETLRKMCDNIIYVKGNHEDRLRRFLLKAAPELFTLEALSFTKLLGLDDLGIQWVDSVEVGAHYTTPYGLVISHMNVCRKHSGFSAKGIVTDKGVSVAHAHVHRVGTYIKTNMDGTIITGYEIGCLCDLMETFIENPNWQNGFAVVYHDEKTLAWELELKLIKNREFFAKRLLSR